MHIYIICCTKHVHLWQNVTVQNTFKQQRQNGSVHSFFINLKMLDTEYSAKMTDLCKLNLFLKTYYIYKL